MDLAAAMTDSPVETFDALLQRHRGIVRKIAASYARNADDRDDLAQEIAAQLWRAWPDYDAARPFSTWMYRIALNTAIGWLREQSRRWRWSVPLQDHDGLPAAPGLDTGADTHERLRVLQRFMATLGALDRALLLLYLEERSGREIAEVLGIGESNVTTRISRLRQRLRDFAGPND